MKNLLKAGLGHFLFWLSFSFVARILFWIYSYSIVPKGAWGSVFPSFWKAVPLDFSFASYLLLPFLLLLFVPLSLFRFRVWLFLSGIIALSFSILNLIDAELFIHWGSRINPLAILYAQNPQGAAASITTLAIFKIIGYLVLHILFFVILFRLFWLRFVPIKSIKIDVIPSVIIGLVLFSALSFVGIRGGLGKVPINQSRTAFSKYAIGNAAANNPLWNALYHLFSKDELPTQNQYVYFSDSIAQKTTDSLFIQGNISNPTLLNSPKPNILVLIMESFGAESSLYSGGSQNLSPKFDKIAKEGLVFEQMYSAGDRTDRGLLSILSGYPSVPFTSIMSKPEKATRLPSVPLVLDSLGYNNSFVYGGDISFANMGTYLLQSGFDNIIDQISFSSKTAKGNWGYHDQDFFNEIERQVNKSQEPFFISGLSLSVHEPFDIPSSRSSKNIKQKMRSAYLYSDSCLGAFLNRFQSSEKYKNTLLIVIGDHGRELHIPNTYFFDPYKFRIACYVGGGALSSDYKGKKIRHAVMQQSILPFILQNMHLSTTPFTYYNNPLRENGAFAFYSFYNGFGFVNKSGFYIYENDMKAHHGPEMENIEYFLYQGKALQQSIIKNYFAF